MKNERNAGRRSMFGEEADRVAISVPKRLKKQSIAICNNAAAQYVKERRETALMRLIESLTEEQELQLSENLAGKGIDELLATETLIFDGEKALFFKRTGLKAWEAFK